MVDRVTNQNRTVHLMGTFRVRRDNRTLRIPHSAARLLAVVGLLGPLSRSQAAGLLWPDGTQVQAMANLRTTLSRLGLVDATFMLSHGEVLEVGERVHLDVRDVVEWVNATIYGTFTDGHEIHAPPPEVGQELLAGWDEEWLAERRDRLRTLQVQALETAAEHLVTAGRTAEAMPYALSAIQAQPWSESATKLVMEIHVRRGNPSGALRQFHEFRTALHRELGVQPGADILATIRQLYPFGSGGSRAM